MVIIFPILAIVAFFSDGYFGLRSVKVFMLYHCIIAIIMIFYQIFACFCLEDEK